MCGLLASCNWSTQKDFRRYCKSKKLVFKNKYLITKHGIATHCLTHIIKNSCLRTVFANIYAAHILLLDSKCIIQI